MIAARADNIVELTIPEKLLFLLEPHSYKVIYGGRNSLKSWSAARVLLTQGIQKPLRILCAREVQNSISDSVHQLLKDQIDELGYGAHYEVIENAIRGKRNNTLFRFRGLADLTAHNIKSIEGFDRLWAEEADTITKRSWQMVLPTIFRNPGSEVWVTFNPNLDTDETWERFVVHPPEGAVVVEMNWRDAERAGWFTAEQERLRRHDMVYSKDEYQNIWEGKTRSTIAGAIYTREIAEMVIDQRYRPTPYDPRFPVHRIWDLGWNDLMVVIMVQKVAPSVLNVINYMEEKFFTYAEMVQALDGLRYRWGDDWLPHDSTQHHPTSGTNAFKQIKDLAGRVPKEIPKSADEPRVRAARMLFPRVYLDSTKRETPPDRPDRNLGGWHLMDRLKRLRRVITKTTGSEGAIMEDINIHAGDAWGSLAEIADRIRNENDMPPPRIPGFANYNSGAGMLG